MLLVTVGGIISLFVSILGVKVFCGNYLSARMFFDWHFL